MNKIKNQTIGNFVNDLLSKRPTPGGGAVAALSGVFAASLCQMVVGLTLGKKGYETIQNKLAIFIKTLPKYIGKLMNLADLDVIAFNDVMKAYKDKNEKLIQASLKKATLVPLETMKICREVADISRFLARKGNKNANSDAQTAVYLSEAAIKSARENVKINIKFIKDQKWIKNLENWKS